MHLPVFGHRNSHRARAVVTGAGSGIGQAFAIELARRDGQVVCSDIDLARAQETVDAITDAGGTATAIECDVRSAAAVADLARQAEGWFEQPPTLMINNAGVGAGGAPIGETPLEDWTWVVDINLWGVIHGCHTFAPRLRAAGGGGIINVASAAGFAAAPNMAAYNVTKAGVMALSETLKAELGGSGVSVTVLCPTFVKTNILEGGRIEGGSLRLADVLMKLTGKSARSIARTTLDAHDRGQLYVVPQIDAQVVWRLKRAVPSTYATALGVANRFAPKPAPTVTSTDRFTQITKGK